MEKKTENCVVHFNKSPTFLGKHQLPRVYELFSFHVAVFPILRFFYRGKKDKIKALLRPLVPFVPAINHIIKIFYSCANASDGNAMVVVTRNYEASSGRYQFPSFVWAANATAPIYLHCKVRICDNYQAECNLVRDLLLWQKFDLLHVISYSVSFYQVFLAPLCQQRC